MTRGPASGHGRFAPAPPGAMLRPGPASTYELDGTQFIAIAMGPELWAFTLDGAVPARGEPVLDPWVGYERPHPVARETDTIETGDAHRGRGEPGRPTIRVRRAPV